jgi:ligand-binding sensor domain-containing protein
VQRYSLEEGLSQQAVNTIVQDNEGFMWFGTEDGLKRFDGYEFRQLRHERGDEETIPNGWISSLIATEDGLWIGTVGGGVARLLLEHADRLAARAGRRLELRHVVVRDLDKPRTVNLPSQAWIKVRDTPNVRAASDLDSTRSQTQANSLSDDSVFSIVHLRNGDTLLGTARGLDRLSAANLDVSRLALPPELVPHGQPLRVRALTEAPDGMVWVGTDAGLGRFDPRSDHWRVYRQSPGQTPGNSTGLPDNRVQSLLIDSQGRLWVGMIDGLSWFDSATETFSTYHRDESEPGLLHAAMTGDAIADFPRSQFRW